MKRGFSPAAFKILSLSVIFNSSIIACQYRSL